MDETIDEIMLQISPIIAAELAHRVKTYLKDVVPGGVAADDQIIKLTKEALADLLDDIQGSISTDIDLAQANRETEIENEPYVYDKLYPDLDLPAGVWDGDSEEAIIGKTKEVGCCGCGDFTEEIDQDIPDGPQNVSLDYDWDDITYK